MFNNTTQKSKLTQATRDMIKEKSRLNKNSTEYDNTETIQKVIENSKDMKVPKT